MDGNQSKAYGDPLTPKQYKDLLRVAGLVERLMPSVGRLMRTLANRLFEVERFARRGLS